MLEKKSPLIETKRPNIEKQMPNIEHFPHHHALATNKGSGEVKRQNRFNRREDSEGAIHLHLHAVTKPMCTPSHEQPNSDKDDNPYIFMHRLAHNNQLKLYACTVKAMGQKRGG